MNPGVYTFEAKLEKHVTATEKQTVIIGQPLNIKLSPTPKTGNLKIMTTPFEATIKMGGKEIGKTPLTLKNQLIGDYKVELSLEGYATTYEKATISIFYYHILAAAWNHRRIFIWQGLSFWLGKRKG